jgi:hypothetical protein
MLLTIGNKYYIKLTINYANLDKYFIITEIQQFFKFINTIKLL